MAKFAFIVDFEEGHLFPTFGLSESLKKRGHEVHYIGIADNEKFVKDQGFEYHSVLLKDFPPGSREIYKGYQKNLGGYSRFFMYNLVGRELTAILQKIKPEGVIINTFLSFEALLIHYKYNINPVIFTPYLDAKSPPFVEAMNSIRSLGRPKMNKIFKAYKKYNKKLVYFFKQLPLKYKIKFTISNLINYRISDEEFNSFVAPVNEWMEIISCPKDFDFPDVKRNSTVHYIGPCIRNKDLDENLFKLEKDNNKEIIFVCLGSQTARIYKTCETFFLKIFELMALPEMKNIHVILSMGSKFETEKFGKIPENVSLYEWIPQIEALKISSAAIIHGGLGSVKECIYYGVPMIVLPDKYDQPANAQRIESHGLGVQGNLENISVDNLKSLVNRILNDSVIKENVTRMQNIFRNKEEQQEGALLIEEYYLINAKQIAPVGAC